MTIPDLAALKGWRHTAAIVTALGIVAAVACGGGGKSAAPAPGTGTGTSAAPAAATGAQPRAADVVPDLGTLGYTLQQKGKEISVPPHSDMAQALYQKGSDAGKAVLVKLWLFENAADAQAHYTTYATLMRNPPPEVLGAASKQADTAAPGVGEQRQSYVSETDAKGNHVYTDILRQGRTVLLVQTIDQAAADLMPARTAIATAVFRNARELK